jgi:hypothetical protein
MDVLVARSPEEVQRLLSVRWLDVQREIGPLLPPDLVLSLEIGDSEHFRTPRGYATTTVLCPGRYHITFSEKALWCSEDRLDAIIRHELGHVLDFSVPLEGVNRWSQSRGATLPATAERRADALALAVWRQFIRYDAEDVQSLSTGTFLRPERLGL